ncbi:MAG: wax ester/triacylglycerol synthase family O-acyltransferase [Deltaproteobacteria bacterium]|nr:MAG: wax ester/triacylglycerol synthase family O-acyltransferase [Deltaproteobacteria bacterium]
MTRPPTRMTPTDAAWLHMDRPESLMMITALLWFDGPVPYDVVLGLVSERLVAVYPRFSRRIREAPLELGPPRWEDDPQFDVARHVVPGRLTAPGGKAELESFCAEMMAVPLDRSRSPWQLHVIEGYDGGRATVLVVRIHHCVADGISLARVLLAMADDAGLDPHVVHVPQEPHTDRFHRPRLSPMRATWKLGETLWHEGVELSTHPARLLELARLGTDVAAAATHLLGLSPDPDTALRGPLGVQKRVAWSDPMPLPRIKAACKDLGCTLNDVLLAAIAGALRRYLQQRGSLVADVRAFVPVNLRPLDQPVPADLGNHFSLAVLPLPVGQETPAARLGALRREMDRIKQSQEPAVAFGILNAVGLTPTRVEQAVLRYFGTKGSAVMTNVPGPKAPIMLGGHKIAGFLFWVPMSAGVGLGVSIFSYAGQVTVGVASDAGLVPDPEAIVAAYPDELAALEALSA